MGPVRGLVPDFSPGAGVLGLFGTEMAGWLVLIRNMLAADLPAVLAVQARCYGAAYHEPPEAFSAKLAALPEACLVAEVGGEVRGYLFAVAAGGDWLPELHSPQLYDGDVVDRWHLHDMAVLPASRDLKLGRGLLERLLFAQECAGVLRLSLVAVAGAEGYWLKNGFRRTKSASDVLVSYGEDAVYMQREVGQSPALAPMT